MRGIHQLVLGSSENISLKLSLHKTENFLKRIYHLFNLFLLPKNKTYGTDNKEDSDNEYPKIHIKKFYFGNRDNDAARM